tara:strand:+ start:18672 stop:19043 length:372 start_codon:yes stop_codon:yes gene_type:complete
MFRKKKPEDILNKDNAVDEMTQRRKEMLELAKDGSPGIMIGDQFYLAISGKKAEELFDAAATQAQNEEPTSKQIQAAAYVKQNEWNLAGGRRRKSRRKKRRKSRRKSRRKKRRKRTKRRRRRR